MAKKEPTPKVEVVDVNEITDDTGSHVELVVKKGKATYRIKVPFYEVVKK